MITYKIKKGTTDVSVVCRAIDSTDGTPETAFDHSAAGIDLKYRRETAANVDITEVALAALTTAHTDGGVEQIGNGYFRLDLPDTACAAGIDGVMIHGVATGMVIIGCYIQLVDYDPFDSVRMGMTALPNAAADAAGGLPISDAGGLDLDAKVGALTFTVANQVDANALAISGDTAAADNLELQYDTTGLTGDTFPSTQAQLSNIANVGSAVNASADSYTLTTGTQSANTYTATVALDGTRHEHTDATGAMELHYEFSIGAGIPSTCKMTGYLTGGNDDLDVYGYDWVATSWVQIGNLQGGAASNSVNTYDMFTSMVGTGANLGIVRVRFYKAAGLTTATLAVDQIYTAFSLSGASALDAIYFDSGASNTNTVPGIDGIPGNPVSTEAAVNTLLAATNLHKVEVVLESTITFATSHIDEAWEGIHWACAQGGQNLSGSHFIGADITGTATASVTKIDYMSCSFGTCSLPKMHAFSCGLTGTLTFNEAGDYVFADCHSAVAGATIPIIDTGATIGNISLSMPNYQQGIEIRNLNATGTDLFSISGIGQIIYAASSSGAVNQRGRWKVTNTGGVTITYDDPSQNEIDTLADTADMQPKFGTIVDLGSGATLGDNLTDIESQTDDIGVAGVGLTNLGGMSTGMKAEVNTEVDTALTDYDPPTNTEMEARTPTAAQLAYIVENSATAKPVTFSGTGTTTSGTMALVDGVTPNSSDDQYKGRLLVFNAGTLDEVITDILTYTGSTGAFTCTAVTFAITSSHTARLT
jgi:hypothetical protein